MRTAFGDWILCLHTQRRLTEFQECLIPSVTSLLGIWILQRLLFVNLGIKRFLSTGPTALQKIGWFSLFRLPVRMSLSLCSGPVRLDVKSQIIPSRLGFGKIK